jgi:dihydrodipicolinate synthase/N-acetylneuraminate lyase
LISAPLITVSAPMAIGSTSITPAAKTSLAKTAAVVKASKKAVSIAVNTTGTTVSKATAQANAIVAELKKSGVSAVTVTKRVGNKTSVSVLVTKKKP